MIIRRETKVELPAWHGTVTFSPEPDRSSATWASQRNTITIEQDGETIRVLETEARKMAEALTAAADLFKDERESACRATMRRINEEESAVRVHVNGVEATRELSDQIARAFRHAAD